MSRLDDLMVLGVGFLFGMAVASSGRVKKRALGGPVHAPVLTFTHLVDAIMPTSFDVGFAAAEQPPTVEQVTALYIAASTAASRAHEAILAAWNVNPKSVTLGQAHTNMTTYRTRLAEWSIDAVLRARDVIAAVQSIQGATAKLKAATEEMRDVAKAEGTAASAVSMVGDLISVFKT